MRRYRIGAMGFAALLLLWTAGCATGSSPNAGHPPGSRSSDQSVAAVPSPDPTGAAEHHGWSAGTIVQTATGQPVPLETVLAELGQAEVIYLGEEHHNRHHIAAARVVLQSLVDRGRTPVLGMEMFSWNGQAALDRQVGSPAAEPTLSQADYLEQVKWMQNWGGAYDDYAPLVAFAKERGLRLRALNAPRPLVRQVGRQGLAQAMTTPEVRASGLRPEDLVEDPQYRTVILDQLKACHGGGGGDRHFQMMYEASLFRDEAMAQTVAQELATMRASGRRNDGPIVSYTGGGHIQYGLPIPNRVARRAGAAVKQVSIVLASAAREPQDVQDLQDRVAQRIADYVWMTPVGDHGPPARCR